MRFFGKRLWAGLCLAAAFLVAPGEAQALTAAYPQVYELGAGAKYYDVSGENSLGLQKQHYVEYTPNEGTAPLVAYGRGFYGKSTLSHVAEYVQTELGEEPLLGLNADFFNVGSGIPIGIVIKEGTLISSAGGAYAVGFRADGTAIFGKPQLTMVLRGTSHSLRVENFNKTRSSYTVNLYDHNWGTETRIDKPGTNVLLEKIDAGDPYIGCSQRLRVVSVTETAESTPIGENQMVLTIAATGDATKVAVFQVGEELTLTIAADDSVWQEAVYAVGGKSLLLNGQAAVEDTPTGQSARTAIGFKDDGTIVFFENDGRLKNYSIGLTPNVLAQELSLLGVKNAINLDGGGSSAMGVSLNGKPLSVVNRPSDGSLRQCANYIFLVNRSRKDGAPAYLNILPERRFVLAGAPVKLEVRALDAGAAEVTLSEEPSWSVPGGLGEVIDGSFVAGSATGTALVEAEAAGIWGSQYLHIISAVSDLGVWRVNEDGALGEQVSQLTVLPGDEVDLSVSGVYKGEPVAMNNQGVSWALSGDIGSIDKSGHYKAGGKDSSGMIVIQSGDVRARVTVVQLTQGEGPNIVGVSLPLDMASGGSAKYSFRVVAGFGAYYPTKEQLTLTLDGAAIDFDYAYATGVVNVELSGLADGQHRLTLIAQDNEGRLARKSVTIQVGEAGASELPYTDVSANHWAAGYIAYLEERGLMQGETLKDGSQTFNPGRNLTRAEFAVMIARYLKLDCSAAIPLPYKDREDIPGWSLGAIRAVYNAGVMTGQDVKGDIYFYPRSNISRQEAMAVIGRILTDKYPTAEQSFTDANEISAWARDYVDRLVTLGLVSGYEDGSIKPLANITRAEIAKILFSLY